MLQPIDHQYRKVGVIERSHGIDGEVVVTPEIGDSTLFDEIDLVYLRDHRGDMVPARIERVRVQQKKQVSFFVKFEHVADRNAAENLRGYFIFLEKDQPLSAVDSVPELPEWTGFRLIDEHGSLCGVVREIIENPAHPLLKVERENGSTILVPLVDEYIESSEPERRTLQGRNLQMLMDLEE